MEAVRIAQDVDGHAWEMHVQCAVTRCWAQPSRRCDRQAGSTVARTQQAIVRSVTDERFGELVALVRGPMPECAVPGAAVGLIDLKMTWKGSVAQRPALASMRLAFYGTDAVLCVEGPRKGSYGDFLRDDSGSIRFFRWGFGRARVCARTPSDVHFEASAADPRRNTRGAPSRRLSRPRSRSGLANGSPRRRRCAPRIAPSSRRLSVRRCAADSMRQKAARVR